MKSYEVKKRDYDVLVSPNEKSIQISEIRNDSFNKYDLSDTGAKWQYHRWGYKIQADSREQFNKVLKIIGVKPFSKNSNDTEIFYSIGGL